MSTPIITASTTITKTLTADTSAYAAGDCIGGLLTLAGCSRGGVYTGTISWAMLCDAGGETVTPTLLIFEQNPTASTFTDQAAVTIADADLAKMLPPIALSTTYAAADNGLCFADSKSISFKGTDTNLYAVLVAGGTVTYDAANALSIKLGIAQD